MPKLARTSVCKSPPAQGWKQVAYGSAAAIQGMPGVVGQTRPGALGRQVGRTLTQCLVLHRCALLLALLVRASALATAPAPAQLSTGGAPASADLLLPETDNDLVALLQHLMSAQHEVVLATHGKVCTYDGPISAAIGLELRPRLTRLVRERQDSPEATLSFAAATAQEQFTNWYLQFQNNPPFLFDLAYNFVNNFSAAANAVCARPAGRATAVVTTRWLARPPSSWL